MNKIKTFIIEDEEPARELLKAYLEDFPEIELKAEYTNGFEGVKAINEDKPDLIFLDVQMPKLSGFEMLELLDHKPLIIFTTAYDEYAIRAFEMNATDYLLKPFSKERFASAVEKAQLQIQHQKQPAQIHKLLEIREQEAEKLQRVAVRSGKKIHVVAVEDIYYLESEGDYVKIHTEESAWLKEKTMKYFEAHLPAEEFVRIHRSYIVNVNKVERLEQYEKESYLAILSGGEKLKVSKSGYRALREVLDL